ncbi:hypothetical protein HYZ98_01270 [Candidatus Peregrinibacteria bacterium]|nr:hypothetical protein [Candidatus Peregrinibacteria bacterium]
MNDSLEDQQSQPFELSQEVVIAYPELAAIEGELPDDIKSALSVIYMNNRATGSFVQNVRDDKPTGDIGYQLDLVKQTIDTLRRSPFASRLTAFIANEEKILQQNKAASAQVIGNKERGDDGVYR